MAALGSNQVRAELHSFSFTAIRNLEAAGGGGGVKAGRNTYLEPGAGHHRHHRHREEEEAEEVVAGPGAAVIFEKSF